MNVSGSGAHQGSLGAMDRIFDNDGLIAAGPPGADGDRHFHQIGEEAQVIHGRFGEILKAAAFLSRALPARQFFEDGFALGEFIGTAGEVLDSLAIEFLGPADLNLVQFVQHIQLGHGQTVQAVDLHGIAPHHAVKPATAPLAASGGTEFTTPFRELVIQASAQLSGEGAFTHAGGVGLGNADDAAIRVGPTPAPMQAPPETGLEDVT